MWVKKYQNLRDIASAGKFTWELNIVASTLTAKGPLVPMWPWASVSTGLSECTHKSQIDSTPTPIHTETMEAATLKRSIQNYMEELHSQGGLCVGSTGQFLRAVQEIQSFGCIFRDRNRHTNQQPRGVNCCHWSVLSYFSSHSLPSTSTFKIQSAVQFLSIYQVTNKKYIEE